MKKLDYGNILNGKSLLLLDFDGPVCSVFAGYPAPQIAAELTATIRTISPTVAASLGSEEDPMEVLRFASKRLDQPSTEAVEEQLVQAETRAVESATPTPGALELIESANRAGLTVGIVSNNSAEAISSYLHRQGSADLLAMVEGRPFGQPDLMKPNPFLLHRALRTAAEQACFIGDSVSDIVAGRAAKVMAIGYANKPGKEARLRDAGADLVVTDL
jgi:phosphoglycolate phosphatase-like HAD superfamily hydrolase